MESQNIGNHKLRDAYRDAVALLLDQALHDLEKAFLKIASALTVKSHKSTGGIDTSWDYSTLLAGSLAQETKNAYDSFVKAIEKKCDELNQPVPEEKTFEIVKSYLTPPRVVVNVPDAEFIKSASIGTTAGLVAGSIIPGVGTIVGGVLGFIGAVARHSKLEELHREELSRNISNETKAAFQHLNDQRGKIIDAILAHPSGVSLT